MRIALGVEYAGLNYAGFQRQNHADTVQGQLEKALSVIADESILINCAGRTDTGVNATGQVISFDVTKERSDRAWVLGTNTKLPGDIAITWAQHVDDSFHARFSATARRYRYIMQATLYRPAILHRGVSTYIGQYDVKAMHDCAQILLGELDFSAFKASDDESRSFCRFVHFINVEQFGPYIVFDIKANAFLHHMVRNIVGSLLEIGAGHKDKKWLLDVLLSKDRNKAGPTAFADGLYLIDVTYPDEYQLPKRDFLGPLWFR